MQYLNVFAKFLKATDSRKLRHPSVGGAKILLVSNPELRRPLRGLLALGQCHQPKINFMDGGKITPSFILIFEN